MILNVIRSMAIQVYKTRKKGRNIFCCSCVLCILVQFYTVSYTQTYVQKYVLAFLHVREVPQIVSSQLHAGWCMLPSRTLFRIYLCLYMRNVILFCLATKVYKDQRMMYLAKPFAHRRRVTARLAILLQNRM